MTLFDPPPDPSALEGPGGYRHDDPATSKAAALRPFRRGSLRHRLLTAYGAAGSHGLTDEQAADKAGIPQGAWKRCSELRALEMIEVTTRTRLSSLGAEQQVCTITFSGRRMLGLVLSVSADKEDGQ